MVFFPCPLQVVITRLKLDKDRKKILERKAKSRADGKEKGKYKEETIEKMQDWKGSFANNKLLYKWIAIVSHFYRTGGFGLEGWVLLACFQSTCFDFEVMVGPCMFSYLKLEPFFFWTSWRLWFMSFDPWRSSEDGKVTGSACKVIPKTWFAGYVCIKAQCHDICIEMPKFHWKGTLGDHISDLGRQGNCGRAEWNTWIF